MKDLDVLLLNNDVAFLLDKSWFFIEQNGEKLTL